MISTPKFRLQQQPTSTATLTRPKESMRVAALRGCYRRAEQVTIRSPFPLLTVSLIVCAHGLAVILSRIGYSLVKPPLQFFLRRSGER